MKVISIIIPCKDDAKFLRECLRCVNLSIQDIPASLRNGMSINLLVAIDAGDGYHAAAKVADDCLIVPTHPLFDVAQSRHEAVVAAMSYASVHATSHHLLFTDADSEVPQEWIWQHIKNLEYHDSSWGSVRLPPGSPFWPTFEEARNAGRLDNRLFEQNCAINAKAYMAAGGFTKGLHEGPRLLRALRANGCSEVRTTMAVVTSDRTESRIEGGFASALKDLPKTGEWQ